MSDFSLEELLDNTESKQQTEIRDSTKDKADKAYQLRLGGMSIADIASFFGVVPQTVYRWLSSVAKDHREFLQQQTASEVIADALLFFDNLEQLYLNEVSLIDVSDVRTIDPDTGDVVMRRVDNKTIETRLRCFKAAMDARQSKLNLMASVGLMPKSPDRIYRDWQGNSEVKLDTNEIDERAKRTPEEIKENIVRLLQNCTPVS